MKKVDSIKNIFLFIFLLFYVSSFAQNENNDKEPEPVKVPKLTKDHEAEKILEQVSEKINAYKTIKAKFTYSLEDLKKQTSEEKKGLIYMQDDKYKMFLYGANIEIFYDGETMATFLINNKEVTLTTPDPDSEDLITPANMFDFYKKGFYYRYLGEYQEKGIPLKVIDFIPEKRDKKVSRIRLKIKKSNLHFYSLKSFGKAGNNVTIKISDIEPNVHVTPVLFKFNEKQHPDVEVIDLRE